MGCAFFVGRPPFKLSFRSVNPSKHLATDAIAPEIPQNTSPLVDAASHNYLVDGDGQLSDPMTP